MPTRALNVLVTGDVRAFEAAMGKAGAATGMFAKKQQSASARMAATGSKMTKGITLPLVAIGVAAAKMSFDFDEHMQKLVGLVGLSQGSVDKMKGSVLDLARETGKSPKELADGLFFIESAGLRGKVALDALRVSAKASAAGLGETKTIADAVTSAMNAYGPKVLSAGHATDLLVGAVRQGKTEAAALAPTIGRVAPQAQALGISFDQVTAALASMTRLNGNADESATQLRGMLMAFLKTPPKVAAALDKMGLSVAGVRKEIREKGLLETIRHLREQATKTGTDFSKVFPNARALAGALELTGKSSKEVTGIFKAQARATGLTEAAFKSSEKTLNERFRRAVNSVRVSLIQFGEAILPAIIPALTGLAHGVEAAGVAFKGLPQPAKEAIVIFAGVAAAAGPLVFLGGRLAAAAKLISGAFMLVTTSLFRTRIAMAGLAIQEVATAAAGVVLDAALAVTGGAMTALGALASVAFGPIGLAVMGLVAVGVLVVTHWKQVKAVLGAVWGWLKGAASAAFGAVKTAASYGLLGPVGLIIARWGQVKAILSSVWGALKGIASSAFNAVAGAIRAAVGAAVGAALALVHGVVSAVRSMGGAAYGAAKTVGLAIFHGIRAFVGAMLGVGRAIIMALVHGIESMAGAVAGAVKGVVKKARDLLPFSEPKDRSSPLYGLGKSGKALVENFAAGITANASKARKATHDLGSGVLFELDAQIAAAQKASQALTNLFDATDKRRAISSARRRATAPLHGTKAERKTQATDRKQARQELAGLLQEQARARKLSTLDIKVTGLERLKAFKDSLKDVRDSLSTLADSAAQAFRSAREGSIDKALSATMLGLDTTFAGQLARQRQGISADPRVAELAAIRARQAGTDNAAEDAANADKLAKAKARQASADANAAKAQAAADRVAGSGSQRLIDAAARRLVVAQAAQAAAVTGVAAVNADIAKVQDTRRADELESELSNARDIAQNAADAAKEGLDLEVANFQASLQAKLDAEAGQLAARKESYRTFVADVQAILAPLGLVFEPSADQEAAFGAAPAKPKPKPRKPKPKHHHAAGGTVMGRFGEFARINELGRENVSAPASVWLPRGAQITPASRSSEGPLIGQVVINQAGGLDEQALAAKLGFQLATRRR